MFVKFGKAMHEFIEDFSCQQKIVKSKLPLL